MAESIINYACRVQDKRNGVTSAATIESLVILAESDLTQEQRRQMIAEWRRLRLL
jgi:hypothetical protein